MIWFEQRLLTLVADAVQAFGLSYGLPSSAVVGHEGFASLQLPQPINLQGLLVLLCCYTLTQN
jgi:hypothetical protein